MAVPKKRRSKSKKRSHHAHWKAAKPNVRACANCGNPILSHQACSSCGHYKGRQVIQIKVKSAANKEG